MGCVTSIFCIDKITSFLLFIDCDFLNFIDFLTDNKSMQFALKLDILLAFQNLQEAN